MNGANSKAISPLRKQIDKDRGYLTSFGEKLVIVLLVCSSRLLKDKLLVLFQRPWGKKGPSFPGRNSSEENIFCA